MGARAICKNTERRKANAAAFLRILLTLATTVLFRTLSLSAVAILATFLLGRLAYATNTLRWASLCVVIVLLSFRLILWHVDTARCSKLIEVPLLARLVTDVKFCRILGLT